GGTGQIDSLLCGLEMMALYLLVANDHEPVAWKAAAAYVFLGLAFLAKGPVGVVIPLGAYIAGTMAAGRKACLFKWHWLWGLLLVLGIAGGWLLLAWHEGAPPAYFNELINKQTHDRIVEGTPGHSQNLFYYLGDFPVSFLPWTFFLPAVAVTARRMENTAARNFLLGWFAFVVLAFTVPVDKRSLYILFVYPAAAILVAAAWPDLHEHAVRLARGGVYSILGLFFFLGIAAIYVSGQDALPFSGKVLRPLAIILPAGAIVLVALWDRHGVTSRWLYGMAGVMLAFQLYVSTIIYPALNDIKTPHEFARIARQVLKPGDFLLIYNMNAEILPLYSRSRGLVADDSRELAEAMRRMKKGMVVFEPKGWEDARIELGRYLKPHYFTFGNKQLIWSEFNVK
ncbi:MAG: hypothetical protein C0404_08625, partial [Verrucomicrobia bacterium]|nr:hypothetical protein [Verrucomicrobiota bacterium]